MKSTLSIPLVGFAKAILIVVLSHDITAIHAAEIEFNRDIRHILADKCFACHGPDEEQRVSELRLDTQVGMQLDLGDAQAVVPGKPEASELVRRILLSNHDDRMPPADSKKQLTNQEKELLIAWIAAGANWQGHWAYEPPQRTVAPSVELADWPKNFIDSFVLRGLEARGWTPSAAADRVTLARRLNFDLLGLPPNMSDLNVFLNDSSPAAYEKLVDQLLRSEHFGERMAMYWLDLVRYADTVGYHGDQDVSISPFRDYVISAFNSNMPFDQFTREQLAGDLLEAPTRDQLVASGYNRLGMMSAEGGVQPEEYLAKYAADRVRNLASVWLGSTMMCAECHDHKYDPYTMRDFYSLEAFFADIKERGLYSGANQDGNWGPSVEVPDVELAELLPPLDEQLAELRQILERDTPELQAAQVDWEAEMLSSIKSWQSFAPRTIRAENGCELTIRQDASILVSGPNPSQNTYLLEFESIPAGTSALRLEVIPDASLPAGGSGRANNGNFVVSEVEIHLQNVSGEWQAAQLDQATATHEQADDNKKNPYGKWSAAATIDQDSKGASWGWAILPDVTQSQSLLISLAQPIADTQSVQVVVKQNHNNPTHTLGCFRVHFGNSDQLGQATAALQLPQDVLAALELPVDQRNEKQNSVLAQLYRSLAPSLQPMRDTLAQVEKKRQETVAAHTRTSLITVAVEPREIRILKRGNWMDKSGPIVTPAVPHFLPPAEWEGRGTRLDLANWLVQRDNPLTARVFVNRLWKLFFGTGLSKALDDLGSQGETPENLELLDTLAVEFMESGWNVKHVIKLMVMSNAYQQASLLREELRGLDPYNRLLARQSRFRLDAETLRDNALAISGLLVNQVGGRSAKPYQPAGLYRHLNFPAREYQEDSGPNQYRRGVYTHWQRQFLHPAMKSFDAPSREECTAERPRSNTPLGALVLLNDPSYVEAARCFAQRAYHAGDGRPDLILPWMFRQAVSREVSSQEQTLLIDLYEQHQAQFAESPDEAEELISIGQSPVDRTIKSIDLAAWTNVARVIFNMHEFITRN